MTFKSTSERQSFQERVASHSTKGFANGRVDVLPPEATEKEVIYCDLKSQYEAVDKQVQEAEKELCRAEATLKITVPYPMFVKANAEKENLVRKVNRLKTERGELRQIVRAAGERAFTECFYYLAQRRLPRDIFKELDIEVEQMMGRYRHEILESDRVKHARHKKNRTKFEKS